MATTNGSLLTPEEAGEYLKVSPRTVLKFLRDGSLKGSKLGKFWRIKEEDLDAFVDHERSTGWLDQYGHAHGDLRDVFYDTIEKANREEGWMDSKENRDVLERLCGRMWNCKDIIGSLVRDDIGDMIEYYLSDYDRAHEYRQGCNCARAARVLKEVIQNYEE